MPQPPRRPIPVNVIAGPLGVGKTTTINHLLEQRPDSERWAVLVNEYGLIGLDAALIESTTSVGSKKSLEIREVAGGCICCSAGFMFQVSVTLLLQRRPDRLLIEPTGLAALSGVLDTLERPGIREAVDVRSIVCLLDPTQLSHDLTRDTVQDQVQAADIIVANRADLATGEQLAAFERWAHALFPSKRYVDHVESGRVPLEWLDLVSERPTSRPSAQHRHGTDHHHVEGPERSPSEPPDASAPEQATCGPSQPFVRSAHASTVSSTLGWTCWSGLIFDAERVSRWLSELSRRPVVQRSKAVLHTTEGWWRFNFARGIEDVQPSGYRRDSRLEIILDGDLPPDTDALDAGLRACVVDSSGPGALRAIGQTPASTRRE